MRTAAFARKTKETDIRLAVNLDGSGKTELQTGVGFFDHMLDALCRFAQFDLTLSCAGDLHIDAHHTVEDVGICLGTAFRQALGDKRGITRYGSTTLPMDEALILSACDLSGRSFLGYALDIPTEKVGTFDTQLTEEFWLAFTREAACNLHLRTLAGQNSHHIIEGAFKSVARSLRDAVKIDAAFADEIPSTKGVLS